jgi:hypothetical protein
VAEVGKIYAADSRQHCERLAAVTPYIIDAVRRQGDKPLDFDRWLAAGDHLPGEAR